MTNKLSEALKRVEAKSDISKLIIDDLLDLLCWEHQHGGYRVVMFPSGIDNIVLKAEFNEFGRQNQLEYEAWHHLNDREPKKAKFFAPVLAISKNGKILIQQRVDRVAEARDFFREDLQKIEVPASFLIDDPHISNFGWIGKQLVCIDYGFVDTIAFARDRMVSFEKFKTYITTENEVFSGKKYTTNNCATRSACWKYLNRKRHNETK